MATSFKTLTTEDIQNTRTLLHEAVPITGSIFSGTYTDLPPPAATSEQNIKNYSHGMFQSVYDYPYLSSSANHIVDISVGVNSGSLYGLGGATFTGSGGMIQQQQKAQIYSNMAQVLVGYTPSGTIRQFDEDGVHTDGNKLDQCYFLNFSRLLSKDEIQYQSFQMNFSVQPSSSAEGLIQATTCVAIAKDVSGSNNLKVNSPAGEYNILYLSASGDISQFQDRVIPYAGPGVVGSGGGVEQLQPCGLIYYQAGIAVLTSSMFKVALSGGLLSNKLVYGAETAGRVIMDPRAGTDTWGIDELLMSGSISGSANAFRQRVQNITFNNTTELNSTIYFCRANASEFNFSSNPTYLSQSKIFVKEVRADEPISYITTVGLYGSSNELMAVGKLSEPLKKTPSNEFTLRVRLDY